MTFQRDDQTPSAPVPTVDAFVTVELDAFEDAPAARIVAWLAEHDLAHLFLFASPTADLSILVRDLSLAVPDLAVTGCTTAGELGQAGYVDDRILAVGLPSAHHATTSLLIENLSGRDMSSLSHDALALRVDISRAHLDKPNAFAFLMVDGLSLREDVLAAALAPGLGGLPLFGGSAGDGARFGKTVVAHGGRVHEDAAILTLVQTAFRPEVFSLNHLVPTETRMVVTHADPDRRIVKEINAEPAGREYARLVGKDPDQLDEFTFAAHPVAVRLGDSHHVRAIQRVNAEGELVFFSAIEEGMVLTVAEPEDIVAHLDRTLSRMTSAGQPAGILACDCVLRRLEADQKQQTRALSEVLSRFNVTGFSTYGEQIGPLHLNQTMTGVAFFADDTDAAGGAE